MKLRSRFFRICHTHKLSTNTKSPLQMQHQKRLWLQRLGQNFFLILFEKVSLTENDSSPIVPFTAPACSVLFSIKHYIWGPKMAPEVMDDKNMAYKDVRRRNPAELVFWLGFRGKGKAQYAVPPGSAKRSLSPKLAIAT